MAVSAPFFTELSGWPSDGAAFWLTTSDEIRIRVATVLPEGPARGTILMFPGRTEYIEKYGDFARDMRARGYAMLCVDWRGQGQADRLIPNPALGHVRSYTDYQRDVAALVSFAKEQNLPEPWHMIAHSMSGATGLRALHDGLPVASACFTGPMWDIALGPILKPLGTLVRAVAPLLGLQEKLTPTSSVQSYVLANPFDDNTLTTDPALFQMMKDQLVAYPELALGGPSIGWFSAAIAECQELAALPSPDYPCLAIMGSNERITDQPAIRDRMARWPGGHLEVVQGGEHEILMEAPQLRDPILNQIDAFFEANAARNT